MKIVKFSQKKTAQYSEQLSLSHIASLTANYQRQILLANHSVSLGCTWVFLP